MTSTNDSLGKHISCATPSVSVPGGGHSLSTGRELMTQVHYAVEYLQQKHPRLVELVDLLSYLSLSPDQRNILLLERALQHHPRVESISRTQTQPIHGPYRYRPRLPITNSDELLNHLTLHDGAMGLSVIDLRDGWPDCVPVIELLESEGRILLRREKNNGDRSTIWPDLPAYHLLHSDLSAGDARNPIRKVDSDFVSLWHKIKIPADIDEVRTELELAGMVPTSVVKELPISSARRQKRKPTIRASSKMTNSHMLGVLKDYHEKP